VAAPAPTETKTAEKPKTAEKVAVVAKEKTLPVAEKSSEKSDKAEKALKEAALVQKPIPAGVHRIVFRCEEEAWLEVRDAAGRQLLSSLNPAGCERVVQGRGPFELVIGNASHVQVLHNDRLLDLRPHSKQDIARFTIP